MHLAQGTTTDEKYFLSSLLERGPPTPLFKEGKHVTVMKKLIYLWPSNAHKGLAICRAKAITFSQRNHFKTLDHVFQKTNSANLGLVTMATCT